jgi:hypothetical protein
MKPYRSRLQTYELLRKENAVKVLRSITILSFDQFFFRPAISKQSIPADQHNLREQHNNALEHDPQYSGQRDQRLLY